MMGNFMEKLQQMQVQMEESKKKLDGTIVEGISPNQKVRAKVNGNRKIKAIELSEDFAKLEKEELEDYLMIALQDALDKAEQIHEKEMKGAAGSLMPGMGL